MMEEIEPLPTVDADAAIAAAEHYLHVIAARADASNLLDDIADEFHADRDHTIDYVRDMIRDATGTKA